MRIREVSDNKREYMPLLLLADEQESMVERYIDRGTMYVLEDEDEVRAECVVTDEGNGIMEVQNLAVAEQYQRHGYGRKMIRFIAGRYHDEYNTLKVCTGDSPLTVPFYESCGFATYDISKNYFLEHYDHPIFEGGRQLRDRVCMKMDLKQKS